jgi:acyl-CoA reductase-like NAD-dependent aldehyde dehydrogenase
VVQGGAEETQELLRERFDKVFYTGSPQVGCIVYQAVAKHLTPVTLELGGKSPAFFADDSVRSLDVLIQRFLFGKMLNLGQTCIAPDYIMCSERLQKLLIERLPAALHKEFGADLKKSSNLCRIVNERHTKYVGIEA